MKISKYLDFINESKEDIDSICKKYNIQNYTINEDGSIDVNGDVDFGGNRKLIKLPIKFRNITGDFSCSNNQLTSLDGCPQNIVGSFVCSNNQLTSLDGCPQSIGGHFFCDNNQLTSLEGGPKSVDGGFDCSNNKLTSLKGCPQKVKTNYYFCTHNKIINFEGFPEYYDGDLYFRGNPVDEILELFKYHPKCIYWINEHDVIQGNKIILQRLEEVAHELKMELPENIKLKNYEII